MPSRRSRPIAALAALAAAVALAAGCGGSSEGELDGSHPDYEGALAGAPAPLAALHRQGNELLEGGRDAFERRLRSLRGYPVVVNVWASWCGPCRFEFPLLQEVSARWGKRVAFLGVDSEDSADAAQTFLRSAPVPYPSYTETGREIADSLGARGLPATAYYDRRGRLAHVKQGPYEDRAAMEADLRRHALGGA